MKFDRLRRSRWAASSRAFLTIGLTRQLSREVFLADMGLEVYDKVRG